MKLATILIALALFIAAFGWLHSDDAENKTVYPVVKWCVRVAFVAYLVWTFCLMVSSRSHSDGYDDAPWYG